MLLRPCSAYHKITQPSDPARRCINYRARELSCRDRQRTVHPLHGQIFTLTSKNTRKRQVRGTPGFRSKDCRKVRSGLTPGLTGMIPLECSCPVYTLHCLEDLLDGAGVSIPKSQWDPWFLCLRFLPCRSKERSSIGDADRTDRAENNTEKKVVNAGRALPTE